MYTFHSFNKQRQSLYTLATPIRHGLLQWRTGSINQLYWIDLLLIYPIKLMNGKTRIILTRSKCIFNHGTFF